MHKRFRSIFKMAIGLVVLSAASTASAVPIQYAWSGTNFDNSWNATGFIVIDDSQFGLTLNDPTSEFLDWMFSWTDGTVTYVNSAATGDTFTTQSKFESLSDGSIHDILLCTRPCETAGHPVFLVGETYWDASTSTFSSAANPGGASGVFSPGQPAAVPEPTSLALLGAGVIAFGVLRRKKRTGGEKCLTS